MNKEDKRQEESKMTNAAEKQYKQRAGKIEYQMETLKSLLDGHGNVETINWPLVGDLGQVTEKLQEIIDFLGGEEALR